MKYYMYKINYDSWTIFENKEELISYFCSFVSNKWHFSKKQCTLFKEINMNGKDCSIVRKLKDVYDENGNYTHTNFWQEKVLKPIMIFDENNRIIDPRVFEKEILSENYDRTKLPKRKINKAKKYNYVHYIYRYDPVPYTSKIKGGHGGRRVRYRQMLREITTKETSKYIRQKKSDLGYDVAWRENPKRHIDKSWKNKKIKKQYMNKKHF